MRDMTRDELQDCLPDLLHGRLSADDAAIVERAIAVDPELAAEFHLLRTARAAHQAPVAINVAQIVGALPAPPRTADAPMVDELAARRNAKRPMISMRFARAAALLLVVGGGTAVTVMNGRQQHELRGVGPTAAASLAARESSAPQLGLGASTDDLSVEQLRALEADILALDGVPSAEPETAVDLSAAEGA